MDIDVHHYGQSGPSKLSSFPDTPRRPLTVSCTFSKLFILSSKFLFKVETHVNKIEGPPSKRNKTSSFTPSLNEVNDLLARNGLEPYSLEGLSYMICFKI